MHLHVPRSVILATGAVLMGLVVSGTAPGAPAPPPRADAVGFAAMLDGATFASAHATSAGHPERRAQEQALVATSGSVGRSEVRLDAVTEGGSGLADAVATAGDVNIAGGRIVASEVRLAVRAHVRPGGAEVGVIDFAVVGLRVDGRAVEAVPGRRIELPGLGTLILLEQVSDGTGSVRANGLRLEVSDAAGGLPVGSSVVIGHLEAVAQSGVPAVTPRRDPVPAAREPETVAGFTPAPARPPLPAPSLPRVRARALPPPVAVPRLPSVPSPVLPRRMAPTGILPPETGGYAFPIHGAASYGDDYGAPRAVTEWHHGNDLFAPEGTPVLAVADGTLFSVGVNTLGGNRLWLRDGRGNTFYYAHLSAYAPVAVEGATVRAGEVVGFVGNTGQAITTPPHLHFEIHPGDGDSVNPYPYLLAWERRTDVALAFRAAGVADGQAPAAGVLIIGFAAADEQRPADAEGLAEVVP